MFWVVGQNFGELYAGDATDPNAGALPGVVRRSGRRHDCSGPRDTAGARRRTHNGTDTPAGGPRRPAHVSRLRGDWTTDPDFRPTSSACCNSHRRVPARRRVQFVQRLAGRAHPVGSSTGSATSTTTTITAGSSSSNPVAATTITIKDFGYMVSGPAATGSAVQVMNGDAQAHTVTADSRRRVRRHHRTRQDGNLHRALCRRCLQVPLHLPREHARDSHRREVAPIEATANRAGRQ